RLAQIVFERLIQFGNIDADHRRSPERLPTRGLPAGAKAEKRQLAVAEKLFGLTAESDHGLRYRAQETVDDENRIERQPVFGKPGRTAHIDEHADQIALLATAVRLRRMRVGRHRVSHEELEKGQVRL